MVKAQRERNDEIWHLYCSGVTQAQLATQFGISGQRISEIIIAQRRAIPERARLDLIQELAQQLDSTRAALQEIVDAEPMLKFDSEGELSGEDHSGRIQAARAIVRVQEREAKLFGLDSPDRVQAETTVRYVVEGADPEAMT